MSRRRSISTDVSTDPKLAEVAESGPLPLLLYTWAIPHADDWGRLAGDARQFRLTVCPALEATAQEIDQALDQVAAAGLWERYESDGKQCIAFPSDAWYRHQNYIPATKRQNDRSQFPPPPSSRIPPHFPADRRTSPQIPANARQSPQIPSSPSPSPTPTPTRGVNDTPPSARIPLTAPACQAPSSAGRGEGGGGGVATTPMPNDTMELLQTNLPSMAVPGVIGSMQSWAGRMGWPMVHEALRQGIGAKGRQASWSYVEGILKRWTAEGIKSLADLESAAARDSPGRPGNRSSPGEPRAWAAIRQALAGEGGESP